MKPGGAWRMLRTQYFQLPKRACKSTSGGLRPIRHPVHLNWPNERGVRDRHHR